jgi:hypothetical protein
MKETAKRGCLLSVYLVVTCTNWIGRSSTEPIFSLGSETNIYSNALYLGVYANLDLQAGSASTDQSLSLMLMKNLESISSHFRSPA